MLALLFAIENTSTLSPPMYDAIDPRSGIAAAILITAQLCETPVNVVNNATNIYFRILSPCFCF
jgi:hypothetical protein